jgi:hypothetical protein
MSDRPLLLQISNRHTTGCGTPPRIEERSDQYLGYFENGYGEQMIFVFDRGNGTGRLYAGDAGWETAYEVVGGVVKDSFFEGHEVMEEKAADLTGFGKPVRSLILSPEEGLWLRACWEAATAGR